MRGGASNQTGAQVVETQAPWRGRHNFVLNSETVLRDAYRLLSLVLGDQIISATCEDERDPLAQLHDQFIEDELVQLLISTAVMNRTQDEHMSGPRNDENELSFSPIVHHCGTLNANLMAEDVVTKPLTLREACNKIIHAEHITAETAEGDGGG